MSSFNDTRPSDDRSQDFQSNPITSGSVQQHAADPSFVNTPEFGRDSLNRDKSTLETSAHNILPSHDHSKPLHNEQDSFVNIPGSFPGDHGFNKNERLTSLNRGNLTHDSQHTVNPSVSTTPHSAKDTIGADIGSNNQYATNIKTTSLYDHTSTPDRVNPDVSATLQGAKNNIGADLESNNPFNNQHNHQVDSGLYDRSSAIGAGEHHSGHHNYQHHEQPGSLHTHNNNKIPGSNIGDAHNMSQLIHDIHNTSLDDKSTQNIDHQPRSTGPGADDNISTRSVHNAPMASSHPVSNTFSPNDSLSGRTGNTQNELGHNRNRSLLPGSGSTGLGSEVDNQINEYKHDISNPADHTNVASALRRSSEFGANSGLDSNIHSEKHHSSHLVNAQGSEAASGMASSAPIPPTYQENSAHRDGAVDRSIGSHANSGDRVNSSLSDNHKTIKPHFGEFTTQEVLTDSFGNPSRKSRPTGTKLVESNEITDVTGHGQVGHNDPNSIRNHSSNGIFNPTNPLSEPSREAGVPNVAHNHDDSLAPSLQSFAHNSNHHGVDDKVHSHNCTLGAGSVAVGSGLSSLADRNDRSEHHNSHSTYPQGGAGVSDVDNRNLNTTGLNNKRINDTSLGRDNTLNGSSRIGSKDVLDGEHSLSDRDLSGKLETNDHLSQKDLSDRSHNENGLSDATNNTPIHRDDSTNAETGTASALGSMLLGKIKQVAGSILGNEELKSEGQATHGQAKENLHEAREMHTSN
ncbi:hypothetical protein K7432_016251 [Basidiobolus ranarum]|uniref:Uncharacterized protein n=1 Tax=Basidiobolus ranarum TaxID=34480 RepID=A0ABR2VLW3_9FUNG